MVEKTINRFKIDNREKKTKMAGYQRYFQGYKDAKVLKKNGGFKIVRIYTAQYHIHDMTDMG